MTAIAQRFSKCVRSMINGGRLKFAITLSGKGWLDDLATARLRVDSKRCAEIAIPLSLETGGQTYRTTIQLIAVRR